MRSKRETILIGLALLSVLYGAYVLLLQPKSAKPGGNGEDSDGKQTEFVQWLVTIQGTLKNAAITPLQHEVVGRALEPWPDTLILRSPLPADLLAAEEARQKALRAAADAQEKQAQLKREEEERRRRSQLELSKRFVYSGYAYLEGAETGTLCAVINNIVYKAGETLEGSPYEVKSITADEVVIVSPEQGIEVHIPVSR